MFYESIGVLLQQAAAALADEDSERVLDARGERERRQVTTLVRRIAAIWPKLFRSLDEETAILAETLTRATQATRSAQPRAPDESEHSVDADPLTRYRALLCALDERVILLHANGQEAWAQEALRSLRSGLAAAAEVQGRLVDEMLSS